MNKPYCEKCKKETYELYLGVMSDNPREQFNLDCKDKWLCSECVPFKNKDINRGRILDRSIRVKILNE